MLLKNEYRYTGTGACMHVWLAGHHCLFSSLIHEYDFNVAYMFHGMH